MTEPMVEPSVVVELLYIRNCPHHQTFLPHLRQLLDDAGVPTTVQLRRLDSDAAARAAAFLGSPTLRINGVDVDPTATGRSDYGLQCRLYQTPAGLQGTPPDAWILDALRTAQDQ